MWLDTLVFFHNSWHGLTGHFRDRRVLDNIENDDEKMNNLAGMLNEIGFNEDEEDDKEFEGEFADDKADDKSNSSSVMRDYRRQLKANPNFVQTLRNMTRIYSSIRHQKLEAMGSSTDPQQLLLTDEIANIERDLSEMNDMINQHENE
uniref:Uncharacterized protein n=1 Tax=Plectus sambesii TaxID=2011161 RepID=A0A914XH19_9BILA